MLMIFQICLLNLVFILNLYEKVIADNFKQSALLYLAEPNGSPGPLLGNTALIN